MANTTQKIAIEIAGKVASSLGKSVDQVNNKLGSIGKMAKVAAGIAGAAFAAVNIGNFVSDAVDKYSSFEQAMAQTAATAGASEEDYELMKKAAREAGKATTKTAEEAANALGYMALAGWDTQQSIEGLMPILRASEAYQTDLATTSDLVTDSLSALGLGVDDLSHYLDVATMANNKSNQSASQMMEAFISAGLTLDDLGDSIENVSGLYGMLANRGTKASEAGTAMKAITVNVKKNAKEMEKLGVNVYDVKGNFVGISKVLEQYNEKTKNMSQEQRDAISLTIAGKNHLGSFNKIMEGFNTTLGDGSTEWETLVGNLNNADGALDTMADKCTGTMQGAMSRLNSAVDDAKISLIDAFGPDITKMIDNFSENVMPKISEGLVKFGEFLKDPVGVNLKKFGKFLKDPVGVNIKKFIDWISDSSARLDEFNDFIQKNKTALEIAAIAVGALGLALLVYNASAIGSSIYTGLATAALWVYNTASGAAAITTGILSAAIGFLTSPVTLAIAAIAALVAIGAYLYNNWDELVIKANELIGTIKDKFPWMADIVDATCATLGSIAEGLKNTFGGIVEFVKGVFSANWEQAWQGVVNIFGGIFQTLLGVASAPLNGIIGLINSAISGVNSIGKVVGIEIPKIPTINVPQLAEGGIATKSTLAEIGEGSEPEAVTPISKLADFINGYIQPQQSQTPQITYSPQIIIQGNANQSDIQQALKVSQSEFDSMMKKWLFNNRRVTF